MTICEIKIIDSVNWLCIYNAGSGNHEDNQDWQFKVAVLASDRQFNSIFLGNISAADIANLITILEMNPQSNNDILRLKGEKLGPDAQEEFKKLEKMLSFVATEEIKKKLPSILPTNNIDTKQDEKLNYNSHRFYAIQQENSNVPGISTMSQKDFGRTLFQSFNSFTDKEQNSQMLAYKYLLDNATTQLTQMLLTHILLNSPVVGLGEHIARDLELKFSVAKESTLNIAITLAAMIETEASEIRELVLKINKFIDEPSHETLGNEVSRKLHSLDADFEVYSLSQKKFLR